MFRLPPALFSFDDFDVHVCAMDQVRSAWYPRNYTESAETLPIGRENL